MKSEQYPQATKDADGRLVVGCRRSATSATPGSGLTALVEAGVDILGADAATATSG